MKELRFEASDGEWRAALAFDPRRKAIVLVAGDKSGGGSETILQAAHRHGGSTLFRPFGKIEGRDEEGKMRWAGI